jgi:1-acyl-sn-glycerol-3-phosphate acyltransferase
MAVYNACYYLAFCTLTLLFVVVWVPVLCVVRLATSRRCTLKVLRHVIALYGKFCVAMAWPYIRVRYREFGPCTPGPKVYVCNHRSSSDPFLMVYFAGEMVQVVNIWPFRIPVLGQVARLAGYLSVREMPFPAFRDAAARLLAQGVSLAAFPEGTRSRDGRVGPFHGALFRVCRETGTPIVPVCIMGNEDKPPRGSLKLRPGIVHVHRLPEVTAEVYRDMTPFKLKNHVRDAIVAHIGQHEGDET